MAVGVGVSEDTVKVELGAFGENQVGELVQAELGKGEECGYGLVDGAGGVGLGEDAYRHEWIGGRGGCQVLDDGHVGRRTGK